jgi:hypothetical protein
MVDQRLSVLVDRRAPGPRFAGRLRNVILRGGRWMTVAESLQRGDSWTILRRQIILFLASLAVFLIAPVVQVSDSRYSVLLSECMLHHRSAELDEFYKVPVPWLTGDAGDPSEANEYQLVNARGHVTYFFGQGSSMLSMPLVAVMNAMGVSAATPDRRLNLAGEIRIERVIASLLMAGLTCVFFAMAVMILPARWSVVVALGAALGSQILSTASRGLWAHTWEIVILGLIAHSLLSAEHRRARLRPAWLATLVAWSYCVRPTGAVAILGVSGYVLWVHREDFVAYAATLAAWLAAFVGYSWSVFGTIIPPYYMASRLRLENFPVALSVNLISPSRGLFVFVPTTLFVLYLIARYSKHIAHKRLAILALAEILALAILICTNGVWTGGYCYGPRYFTDTVPWFVLLAILGLDAMRIAPNARHHRIEIAAAIFLLAVSVVLNVRGASSYVVMDWVMSDFVKKHGIADWRYPQFMAGLMEPPQD